MQFAKTNYTYSQRTVDFIVNEIKNDPENIITKIKERLKQKTS